MKQIPLKNRHGEIVDYAVVDDEDFDRLNQHTWRRSASSGSRVFYAERGTRIGTTGPYRKILMHREVMGLGEDADWLVDHRSCDGLDNRKENLRYCTKAQNNRNARLSRANSSGYKGVTKIGEYNRWVARIRVDTRLIVLGYFDDPAQAHAAYVDAARKYHGEFAHA